MKIGFDAKRLFLNYTGLGNYSRTVVSDLQKHFPEHEYHLYTTKALRNPDTEHFFDTSKFIIHENSSIFNSFWRSAFIIKDLKRDSIDIFHGLSAELPLGIKDTKIKSIVTIHDLIFKHFKSDYKFIDRYIYNFKSKYSCTNADSIIAISEFTKKDIVESYQISESKISVIYLQISDRFMSAANQIELNRIRDKFSLPEKFFLYVGSVISRKNLKIVVEAMSNIDKDQRIPLVVVGTGKKYLHKVKELIRTKGLDEDIIFLKSISNEDLPKIYYLSDFFVFPSLYEGFGLPVLEAIQSGKKVIASENTSLVEVAGDCGIILPQNDVKKLAETIIDLSKQNTKSTMNCRDHLMQFKSETISQKIMQLYENLLATH